MDYLQPPQYCPDALATDVGWINPKNGELLIAVRNLRQKLAERDAAPTANVSKVDDRSPTQKILDELTELTVKQPKVDERSDTQKILDTLTTNLPEREDVKTQTETILEAVTQAAIDGIITTEGKTLSLDLSDASTVKESFGPPKDEVVESTEDKKTRGRPRKSKTV